MDDNASYEVGLDSPRRTRSVSYSGVVAGISWIMALILVGIAVLWQLGGSSDLPVDSDGKEAVISDVVKQIEAVQRFRVTDVDYLPKEHEETLRVVAYRLIKDDEEWGDTHYRVIRYKADGTDDPRSQIEKGDEIMFRDGYLVEVLIEEE